MCGTVTFWVPRQCQVFAGLVILRKCTSFEFTIIKSRAVTLSRSPQCRAFSRTVMAEKSLSPLFPVGGEGQWLQMTGALDIKWTASSEFGTYRLCEQRRFRRACASAQSHQNLHCSLIQAVSQEEPTDRKPDPWPLWMAGHAQLKFVMTECSKTQIRLTGLKTLLCSSKTSYR